MTSLTATDLDSLVSLRRDHLAAGVTDSQLRRLVRTGELVRLRRGAYVEAAVWTQLGPEDRHRLLCRAVLRTQHPSTVLTHVSAAVERGAPVWNIALDEVHTTRTDGRTSRRESGVVHHRGLLSEEDVEVVNGVRVSGAARTAVEVMSMTTVEPALVTVNGMLHAGLLTQESLVSARHEHRYWPHTLVANIVTRLADPRIESVAESRAFYLCWAAKLPCPTPQVEVRDPNGVLVARVDLAWPGHGVFLEVDGREKYRRFRRPGETLEEYLMREKEREEKICQLTGWTCIRISWRDLEHPERTARRIAGILAGRKARPGA